MIQGQSDDGRCRSAIYAAGLLVFCLLTILGPAHGEDAAVILQYHHIGTKTPAATSVTPEQFDQHLAYLQEQAFAVWPLERIVSHLQAGEDLPPRCIAITFDDAYVSVGELAVPRLRERGWPCLVFVTSDGVDHGARGYLTWNQMRALATNGVTFGSHSRTHDYLVRRRAGESAADWEARVTADIQDCRRRLTAELGVETGLFAYPYGEYDDALKRIVRGLGLVGCGQHSGGIWSGSDFGALPRFPMAAGYADLVEFKSKVHSLPLPVIQAEPESPVLAAGVDQPRLRLHLAPGAYRIEELAAYASGQGRIEVRLVDPQRRIVELICGRPLPTGRSRYNCTAPHTSGGRFYWYSHLWIRGATEP